MILVVVDLAGKNFGCLILCTIVYVTCLVIPLSTSIVMPTIPFSTRMASDVSLVSHLQITHLRSL